jgi:DNA-binding transcriptional regulator YiaG
LKHGTANKPRGFRAILTDQQISEIRELSETMTQRDLAKKFNVKRGCIQYWLKHNRPLATVGYSVSSINRRKRQMRSR